MDNIGDDREPTQMLAQTGRGTPLNLSPGQLLSGRYMIVRELGRGGMGIVLEVENVFIKKKFALKILDMRAAAPAAVARFQREAKLLSELNHPNLVQAIDFGLLDESTPYVLMELIHGQTLAQYLSKNGPLNESSFRELFVPILGALQYAHTAGIIHRDIKPGNIMLIDNAQGAPIPKLLDFGIAVSTESAAEALTRTGEIMGTPLYMTPEQVSGGTVNASSDIYSLGCVMYESLTGAPPFRGRTAFETMMLHKTDNLPSLKESSLGGTFSVSLERTLQKMMEKSNNDRYQNCNQVIEALSPSRVSTASSRNGVFSHEQKRASSSTRNIVIGGSVLSLFVAFATISVFSLNNRQPLVSTAKTADSSKTPVQSTTALPSAASKDDQSKQSDDNLVDPPVDKLTGQLAGADEINIEVSNVNRSFNIPESIPDLGQFQWLTSDGQLQKKNAIGHFDIPQKVQLWFKPGWSLLENPAYMAQLSEANLHGIIISPILNLNEPESPVALSNCIRLMPADALYIENKFLPKSAIKILASRNNIKWLSVKYFGREHFLPEDVALKLAEMTCLKDLKVLSLSLDKSASCKPFLEKLASLNSGAKGKLIELGLQRCKLDEKDLENIAKLSSLQYLNLIDCFGISSIDPEICFKRFNNLNNLTTLAISAESLKPAVANQIIRFRKLRRLVLKNPEELKPEARDILKKHGCTIEFVTNPDVGFQPWKEKFEL